MKTRKFVLLSFALMMGATSIFAQGWRNAGRPGYGYGDGPAYRYGDESGYGYGAGYRNNGFGPGSCLMILPGLTEEQRNKITEMEINHQKGMVELRVKQRAAMDPVERNEIRGEMMEKILAHRDAVREQLTEQQQKQLDLLQSRRLNNRRGFAPGCRGRRGGAAFGRRGGGYGYRGRW